MIPTKPEYIKDSDTLASYICHADNGKFCQGKWNISRKAVCDNYSVLPVEVRLTGIHAVCAIDYQKICTTEPYKSKVCSDTGDLEKNLCELYPEKCMENVPEYEPCTKDIYDCVATN